MSSAELVQFRSAVTNDAARVASFVNAAYRGEDSKRGWTTEADLLDGQRTDTRKIEEIIADSHSRLELCFGPDAALLGCVYLHREPSGVCYLGMLTVDPGLQAQGLGTKLIAHAEQVARHWECSAIRMTVIHLRGELIRYYERRGFLPNGVTSPFPVGDPTFGLPKVPLHFVELSKPL